MNYQRIWINFLRFNRIYYIWNLYLCDDYALWVLFGIFVGIALSIDLRLFGKLKNTIIKQKKNPIHDQTQDILDSNHESFQKLQQQQTSYSIDSHHTSGNYMFILTILIGLVVFPFYLIQRTLFHIRQNTKNQDRWNYKEIYQIVLWYFLSILYTYYCHIH